MSTESRELIERACRLVHMHIGDMPEGLDTELMIAIDAAIKDQRQRSDAYLLSCVEHEKRTAIANAEVVSIEAAFRDASQRAEAMERDLEATRVRLAAAEHCASEMNAAVVRADNAEAQLAALDAEVAREQPDAEDFARSVAGCCVNGCVCWTFGIEPILHARRVAVRRLMLAQLDARRLREALRFLQHETDKGLPNCDTMSAYIRASLNTRPAPDALDKVVEALRTIKTKLDGGEPSVGDFHEALEAVEETLRLLGEEVP